MTAASRALVWIVGALSTAVLLRLALDASVRPPSMAALDAFDAAVRAAFGWAESSLSPHLPMLYRTIGAGTQLQAHWPHVFLVAFLSMAPRFERDTGLSATASLILRLLQFAAAIAVAFLFALYVGTAPIVGANETANALVIAFLIGALVFNTIDDLIDDEDRDAASSAADSPRGRWFGAFLVTVALTLVVLCLVAGVAGLMDAATIEQNISSCLS